MTLKLRRFAVLSFSLLLLAASSEAAKRIHLEDLLQDVLIQARVRHTTVIVLPPSEIILDYVAGDTTTWAVTGSANVAYLKPGEKDSTTNIVLVCESGNIYSFKVTEDESAEPDLVVYIDYAAAMIDEETPGSIKPSCMNRSTFPAWTLRCIRKPPSKPKRMRVMHGSAQNSGCSPPSINSDRRTPP